MVRRMLHHLEELFFPVQPKYHPLLLWRVSEFDELPPKVELVEGFPDNLSDMVRNHDHSLVVLDDFMMVSGLPTYLRTVHIITEYP